MDDSCANDRSKSEVHLYIFVQNLKCNMSNSLGKLFDFDLIAFIDSGVNILLN